MLHPIRPFPAALACGLLLLSACSGGGDGPITPPAPVPTTLQVTSRDPHRGLAGERLPDSVVVRVLDQDGRALRDVPVLFAATAGGGSLSPATATTNAEGYAKAAWTLGFDGEQSATARVEGLAPAALRGRAVAVSESARPMLLLLESQLVAAAAKLAELLPLNPQSAPQAEAKLAVLRTPGIGGDILEGRRYAEGSVTSRSGSVLPVTAVFPLEGMRVEAGASVRLIESAVPVLEEYLATPFPAPHLRLWHGFVIGSSGGGGTLHMEDRATYESRTTGARLPYDAIVVHEISHSYFGSESLTQFLELYAYNVLRTGAADPAAWGYTRDYVPGREANEGVHALLDVHRLIGPEAMARALRDIVPLRPPYGQPLSAQARQVFVDAAPEAAKAAVAAKVAKVQA